MSRFYRLNPDHSVSTVTIEEWAMGFDEFKNRKVATTDLEHQDTKVHVSTVFLGLNHQYGDGPPLIFETMIFGGPLTDTQERYSTWDEAVAGHLRWAEAALKTITE